MKSIACLPVVLAHLCLFVTGTRADLGCTMLVITYDGAHHQTQSCATVDDGVTTFVVPYGSQPAVRGRYTVVPSSDGLLDKFFSLAVRKANSNQPMKKLGRGYANVAVANLRTNMSTWTQEYRPTGTACLHGLEVCALVAMYSSGVLVEKKRGCMLIKCLQQDAPVSLPTHNKPTTTTASPRLSSRATRYRTSVPVSTSPPPRSSGTSDTEPSPPSTQDVAKLVSSIAIPVIGGCGILVAVVIVTYFKRHRQDSFSPPQGDTEDHMQAPPSTAVLLSRTATRCGDPRKKPLGRSQSVSTPGDRRNARRVTPQLRISESTSVSTSIPCYSAPINCDEFRYPPHQQRPHLLAVIWQPPSECPLLGYQQGENYNAGCRASMCYDIVPLGHCYPCTDAIGVCGGPNVCDLHYEQAVPEVAMAGAAGLPNGSNPNPPHPLVPA